MIDCILNVNIVDIILCTLPSNLEAEYVCIDQRLRFFEPIKSESVIVGYQFYIKNIKLVIWMVSLGSLFGFTARQVKCAREKLTLGYLGGCSEAKVSLFARIATAV